MPSSGSENAAGSPSAPTTSTTSSTTISTPKSSSHTAPASFHSSLRSSSDTHKPASSQPAITSSDHSVHTLHPLVRINISSTSSVVKAPNPRSTSLPFTTAMGQTFSRGPFSSAPLPPPPPPSSPSTAARGLNAAFEGGSNRLKRAFAGRRKKQQDEPPHTMERARSRDDAARQGDHQQPSSSYHRQRIEASPSSASSPAQVTHSTSVLHRGGAKHLTQLATQVFNVTSKRSPKSPLQQPPSQPQQQHQQQQRHPLPLPPPPLPPKKADAPKAQLRPPPVDTGLDNRSSIIPISPGISSAVNYMRLGEEQRDQEREQDRVREKEQERERQQELEVVPEKTEGEKVQVEKESQAVRQDLGKEKEKDAEKAAEGVDKAELKDTWRKSDSTIGHHTIRPGTATNRPSRPVSMAESLQSNHTIVQRLSALITDADFGMPEEEDGDKSVEGGTRNLIATDGNTTPTVPTHQPSPTPSIKTKNRRSMSLNITPTAVFVKSKLASPIPTSASFVELKHSEAMVPPLPSRDAAVLARTATNATGIIAPSSPPGSQSTGSNIRGKLSALTMHSHTPPGSSSGHSGHGHSGSNNSPFPPSPSPQRIPSNRQERNLPPLPPHPPPSSTHHGHHHAPSLRQPAISLTSGFARRVVGKITRAWDEMHPTSSHDHSTSNSTVSGYSSSGSANTGTPPSSYSGHHPGERHDLRRTVSNQSSSGAHGPTGKDGKGKLRRTPNAPSVSSTASTTASISDSDAFAASGPTLGKQLRGPLRLKSGGSVSGGVVFKRDLRSVVRDTGVGVGKPRAWGGRWRNWDEGEGGRAGEGEEGEREAMRVRRESVRRGQLKALEERRLPALVVRCAQHLLIWGVQEEGLFRVSGRPSHVAKIRTEFDTGADFDMTECTPGDLDPHAVASVFKAFLRELPEPILTHALQHLFDAAMNRESAANAADPAAGSTSPNNVQGSGLPTNPRHSALPAMRKPPSLSTLAMPSFTGIRPPSKALLNAFQTLIEQLPEENRDLLRTVAELIKATARESKETKMPLSNLLLVFCPSLNMNPPLLRILCEGEGIWDPADAGIEDSPVFDISARNNEEEAEEEFSDARDGTEEESVGRTSEDVPNSVEYHASSEDVRARETGHTRRDPVSTVYLDTESIDSSSLSHPTGEAQCNSMATSSIRDDGSSYTSEDQDNLAHHYSDTHYNSMSPPLLTSSTESFDSPSMGSSSHPSFSHLHILPIDVDGSEKNIQFPVHQGAPGPIIAEPSPMDLAISQPRKSVISGSIRISGPIHFPSSPSEAAHTPATVEKRRSIPVLSLPTFSRLSTHIDDEANAPRSPDSVHSPGSLSIRAKRMKKPSLQLLFSKKSTSSLSSPKMGAGATSPSSGKLFISEPYLETPRSASDSSVSTPLSAVTAPQSSTFTLPPTIDTPIEHSPLKFAMGLGIDTDEVLPVASELDDSQLDEAHRASTSTSRPFPSHKFSASTTSLTSSHTPIADLYNYASASKSSLSLASPPESQTVPVTDHLRPYLARTQARARGASTSSKASSNHLGMLDDEEPEEDWTKSVLLAADVDGGWAIKQPIRG